MKKMKKIYNIINNERTLEIANFIDINKFDNFSKPILLIIGSSVNKIISFEDFIKNNLNNLISLSKKYDIIIRPHPRCAGSDIYNKLKKINNNFTIDTNITFITAINKSYIIISYGLTSLLDNYALWTDKKILLIYEKYCWKNLNHKKFKNTNKIINENCCEIQHETNIDIISGIKNALKMNNELILRSRKEFLNNYFFMDEKKKGHKKFLRNILQNKNILIEK